MITNFAMIPSTKYLPAIDQSDRKDIVLFCPGLDLKNDQILLPRSSQVILSLSGISKIVSLCYLITTRGKFGVMFEMVSSHFIHIPFRPIPFPCLLWWLGMAHTVCSQIQEVKQHWPRLVLGWATTCACWRVELSSWLTSVLPGELR